MSCQYLTRVLNAVLDAVQSRASLRHRSTCKGWEHCSLGQGSVWKKPEAVSDGQQLCHRVSTVAAGQLMGFRAQLPLGWVNPEWPPTLSCLCDWMGNRQRGSYPPASLLLCYKSNLGTGKGAVEAFLETLAQFSDLWLPEEGYSTLLLMICLSNPWQGRTVSTLLLFSKFYLRPDIIFGSYLQYKQQRKHKFSTCAKGCLLDHETFSPPPWGLHNSHQVKTYPTVRSTRCFCVGRTKVVNIIQPKYLQLWEAHDGNDVLSLKRYTFRTTVRCQGHIKTSGLHQRLLPLESVLH